MLKRARTHLLPQGLVVLAFSLLLVACGDAAPDFPTDAFGSTPRGASHPCPNCTASLLQDLVQETVDIEASPGQDYGALSPTSFRIVCDTDTTTWSEDLDTPSSYPSSLTWTGVPGPDEALRDCVLEVEASENFVVEDVEIR